MILVTGGAEAFLNENWYFNSTLSLVKVLRARICSSWKGANFACDLARNVALSPSQPLASVCDPVQLTDLGRRRIFAAAA
jgi:hypothetical protein